MSIFGPQKSAKPSGASIWDRPEWTTDTAPVPDQIEAYQKYIQDATASVKNSPVYAPVPGAGNASNESKGTLLKHLTDPQRRNLIAQRLRFSSGDSLPLDFMATHVVDEDKVLVFIVKDGTAVTLEDNNLFPSDTLIGQIRLMITE